MPAVLRRAGQMALRPIKKSYQATWGLPASDTTFGW
nr:MAG TPA: hypothetical protein [Caudoviricetes sp.]